MTFWVIFKYCAKRSLENFVCEFGMIHFEITQPFCCWNKLIYFLRISAHFEDNSIVNVGHCNIFVVITK